MLTTTQTFHSNYPLLNIAVHACMESLTNVPIETLMTLAVNLICFPLIASPVQKYVFSIRHAIVLISKSGQLGAGGFNLLQQFH